MRFSKKITETHLKKITGLNHVCKRMGAGAAEASSRGVCYLFVQSAPTINIFEAAMPENASKTIINEGGFKKKRKKREEKPWWIQWWWDNGGGRGITYSIVNSLYIIIIIMIMTTKLLK